VCERVKRWRERKKKRGIEREREREKERERDRERERETANVGAYPLITRLAALRILLCHCPLRDRDRRRLLTRHDQLLFRRHLQLQRSVRLLVESLAIVTERQRSKSMRERATN
jgi:hypothetical protein